MVLDPKKFALLTSAIAASIAVVGATASGCTEKAVDDAADSGDDGTSSSSSSSSSGSSSGDGGDTSDGGGSSSGDGGSSSGDGGSCLGEGVAPSCDTPTGCLAEPGNESTCAGLSSVLKPAIAAAVVECLNTRPTCEGDDGSVDTCREDAIAQSCPDATAPAFCDTLLATACEETPAEDVTTAKIACAALVPALSQPGKDSLGSCIDEYGCDPICFEPGDVDFLAPPVEN